jgi:hypothetical protein
MENNFIDPVTKEEFFISSFRCTVRNGLSIHTDKTGRTLTNPTNGTALEFIEKKDQDFSTISFTKSNRKEVRTEMLQKRSKEHFKKEISEQKYEKNKQLIKNFKEQ